MFIEDDLRERESLFGLCECVPEEAELESGLMKETVMESRGVVNVPPTFQADLKDAIFVLKIRRIGRPRRLNCHTRLNIRAHS